VNWIFVFAGTYWLQKLDSKGVTAKYSITKDLLVKTAKNSAKTMTIYGQNDDDSGQNDDDFGSG
jgi:hypothetical protein